MQPSENSSSLKAGSTKNKNQIKSGVGNTLSKKGGYGRLKGPVSGTKTSQSQMNSNIVVVDGKVRTPKELITERYREYTQQYLKLLQNRQQHDKKAREAIQIKVKSSLNSHNDSEMKGSSSNFQQKSDFMSSSKSQADSQNQSKKERQHAKKDPKALTIQDLQANIPIKLQETQTIFTFHLPSSCFNKESDQMKVTNKNYRQYMQKRIGSDNYIARPVQTFNFQHKKISQGIQKPNNSQNAVIATTWDIQDTMQFQKKTQYEVLQQDIKKTVDSQFSNYLTNPFSCLSLAKQSIELHSKFPVPGALQYHLRQKDRDKNARSKKLGLGGGPTGLGQVSTSNNRQSDSRQNDSNSKKKQSSQNNSNSRKGLKSAQIQQQINQEQQRVDQDQKKLLDKLMNIAKDMPSQAQRSLMQNQNLQKMLKYIDRILNSQTFHRQYILYRNYPQIQFTKRSPQDQLGRNFKKKKQQAKKQQTKQPLQYLFNFKCKILQGYSVTSADWNPVNKDLLAVSYELVERDTDSNQRNGINKGYLMFWTLKNPAFPEKIFSSQSRITTCKFSVQNPNLIACGTYDGVVAIYDIRKKDNKPISQNKQSMDKHTNAVWDIQWISKGKGNKGQSLVSISSDGRITEWSMKKGLQYTDLMLLKRVASSNKKDSVQNMNFRFASGLSFEFLKSQSSMYLATTQQGVIYRCSKSYTQQSLETYFGHNGPIYKVRANPFFHDIFLSCSADWSCKLWNWRQDQPLYTFQSLDLTDQVIDIQWSPLESAVFASVCKDGRLQLWDLQKKNMLDPIAIVKGNSDEKPAPKTMVKFCRGAPVLVTGDLTGNVNVYRLNRDEDNLDNSFQTQKLKKLVYPNGYKLGNAIEENQSEVIQQKKEQQNVEEKI